MLRSLEGPPTPMARVLAQPVWPLPRFACVLLLLVVVSVSLYPLLRTDIMERPFGRNGWMYGWPLSHLLLFFVLGLSSPRHWFVFFMLGVLWEVVEMTLSTVDAGYWYYILHDITINGIGLALGTGLGLALRKSQPSETRKAAAAFTLCVAIAAFMVLIVNESWKYVLDRKLTGQPRATQDNIFRNWGVSRRCGSCRASELQPSLNEM